MARPTRSVHASNGVRLAPRLALPATIACLGLLAAAPAGAQSPSVAADLPSLTQLWSGSGPGRVEGLDVVTGGRSATGDIWVAASLGQHYSILRTRRDLQGVLGHARAAAPASSIS